MNFVHRRMYQELAEKPENGRYGTLFEELDEAFGHDVRYIKPLQTELQITLMPMLHKEYMSA